MSDEQLSSVIEALEELGFDDDEGDLTPMAEGVLHAWETRRNTKLRPDKLPPGLRDLIPFAEKWGISSGLARSVFRLTASADDTRDFMRTLTHDLLDDVSEWLSLDPQDEGPEKEAFLYMSTALAELGAGE